MFLLLGRYHRTIPFKEEVIPGSADPGMRNPQVVVHEHPPRVLNRVKQD